VRRGVYVWNSLPESVYQILTAVRRRLPAEAVFSGRTAAWLHGIDLPPCDPVDATVSKRCGISARAGLSLRRVELADGDVVSRHGMPVTSILRTLVDLSQQLTLVEAIAAMDAALQLRLVDEKGLRGLLHQRAGCMGVVRLRRVVELADPAAESPMESRLRALLILAGLPRPQVQVKVYDELGRFLGRPDLYYASHRLGIEYDGGTHRDRLVDDNRRQNRLTNAGIRLLRYTAADLLSRPDQIVGQVRCALGLPPA